MTYRRWSWIVSAVVGLCLAGTTRADKTVSPLQKSSPQVLAAFRAAVARPAQSTVRILCEGQEAALGAVVAADGFILTKASELKGKIVCKLRDGRELEGKLVGVHQPNDLAMLKIEAGDLTPITWSDSKQAPVGNWLASPGPAADPVAVGVVSVATRPLSGKVGPAPAPPPADSGYLGVGLENHEGQVKIGQILPGSSADKAGLKVKDIILAIGAKPIEDPESLVNAIQRHKPGTVVKIKVKRGDDELVVEATLGRRPAGQGDYQNQLGSELSNRRGGFPAILQHDTVLRPSDCGGPLVDLDGKVVGINIARAGRTETYAVPAEAIVPLLSDLKSGKLPPPVVRAPTPAEKLSEAKAAWQKAEADKRSAIKKAAEAQATYLRAEAHKAAALKKADAARAALERAEAETQKNAPDKD